MHTPLTIEATRDMQVHVGDLNLTVDIGAGERIHTEISAKFTRRSVAAMFDGTGLGVCAWFTDPAARFAVVLACPRWAQPDVGPQATSP